MDDYTPTRNELLTALVYYRARDGDAPPPPISDLAAPDDVARYLRESEAGLAEVERAAAEKALTDAAEAFRVNTWLVLLKPAGGMPGLMKNANAVTDWLRARAAAPVETRGAR